jgi:hypothetical protein
VNPLLLKALTAHLNRLNGHCPGDSQLILFAVGPFNFVDSHFDTRLGTAQPGGLRNLHLFRRSSQYPTLSPTAPPKLLLSRLCFD